MGSFFSGEALVIPDEVLKNAKELDKSLESIAKHSKDARDIWKDWFSSTTKTSISGVANELERVQRAVAAIAGTSMRGFAFPKVDGSAYGAEITKIADAVKLIDKSATTGASRMTRIADALTKLSTASPSPDVFENIAKGIERIGNTSQATIANVSTLAQAMATLARDIRTVQQAQNAQSDGTAKASQYNKLYKEQADLVRQKNELERRGTAITAEEQKRYDAIRDRIAEINAQIDRLNKKKQTAASTLAQTMGSQRVTDVTDRTTVKGALTYAKNARSVRDMTDAMKNLKAVMATVDPKSAEWERMNAVYLKLRGNIDEVRKKMGEFQGAQRKLMDTSAQLARWLAGMFSVSAITGYINKLVEVRAQFELQQTALRAILQDKDEADKIYSQVQQLALQSPFSISQMTTYTKQLAAYRIESEKLVGTTKMLADVSAGLGVDMQRLILAYGQVKAANYLRATEVRQFTEAGLNIAGELATYFSELKGQMVSVGDVMDMITKRMVRFEDVEEVFNRVTSAGGLFYDMQKKQSDTLWGQMQRIKDAMDIMFNEIGKSNQGTISTVLTTIRALINNWRIMANVLEGVSAAMAAYALKTVYAAVATNTLSVSQNGLVKAVYKSVEALKTMGGFLMKNPYVIAVAGVVAAGYAIADWNKKVNSAKDVYYNMVEGIDQKSKKLNDISAKIADNNKKIAESSESLKNAKKGTEEYNTALGDNKSALAGQFTALQQLKEQFPEVYAKIVQAKDGTVELTEAIESFNMASKMFSIISTLSADDTNWFNEDFKKDMEDVSASQEKYNAALAKAQAYYNTYVGLAEAAYNAHKADGSLTQKQADAYQKILSIRESTMTAEQKIGAMSAVASGHFSELRSIAYELQQSMKDMPSLSRALVGDTSEAEKEVDAMVKRVMMAAGATTVEDFLKLDEAVRDAAERASQQMVTSAGLALTEIQRDILRRKWEIPLKMSVMPTEKKAELSYLQEQINAYISKHPEVEMPLITATEDTDNYFKSLKQNREQDITDQKQYNKASAQLTKNKTNAQVAAELAARAAARKAMMDYFGIEEKKSRGGRKEDAELKHWQEIKKAIEDANKSFERYRKYYSESESIGKIQVEYGQAFEEMGISLDHYYKDGIYDTQALIKALEVLKSEVNATDSSRKRFLDDLIRKISSEEIEVGIKAKEDSIKKLKADLEDMFANYELTKTFEKLGFGVDFTYLVGGRPTTLEDVRRQLDELKALGTKDAEERIKELEAAEKKLTDILHKEAMERLKSYDKYLVKGYGESAKVQIDYFDKLRQMTADFDKYETDLKIKLTDPETTDEDKKRISALLESLPGQAGRAATGMREEMNKEIAKINFENLMNSPLFSEMFQDLGSLSNKVLDNMLAKIEQIKASEANLSLSQIHRLSQYSEKLQNAKIENSPFIEGAKAIAEAYKNIAKGITAAKANATLAVSEEELQRLETLKEDISFVLGIKEKEYQFDGDSVIIGEQRIKLTAQQAALMNKSTDQLNEQAATTKDIISSQKNLVAKWVGIVNTFKKAKTATEKMGDALQMVGEAGLDAMDVIVSGMQLFGKEVSESDQMWIDFAGQVLQSCITLGMAFVALGIQINEALGIIGLIATALTVVSGLLKTILGAHDAKLNKSIENLQTHVDLLERSFQKLEASIDSAFTALQLRSDSKEAIKNLQAQKAAYESMIRLEQQKKKTDSNKIKEYNEAIEDINDRIKELKETITEKWGGFGSQDNMASAAEAFAEAWLDAYKETGDGLDALTEKWDEYIDNLISKQLYLRVVSVRMKKLFDMVDKFVSEDSEQGEYLTANELQQIYAERDRISAQLNDEMKQLLQQLGYVGGNSGDLLLSDLQKGIQNITEPQAAAIEAYLNSMRFAVYQQNEMLTQMLTAIQGQYDTSENPLLTEVKAIRTVLDDFRADFRKVMRNTTGKGWSLQIN